MPMLDNGSRLIVGPTPAGGNPQCFLKHEDQRAKKKIPSECQD